MTDATAQWIRGRVISLPENHVCIKLGEGIEYVISRQQAVALATRLLETGIGTNYAQEREINAMIGDIICDARAKGIIQ